MEQPKGITVQLGNGKVLTLKEYRRRELLMNVPLWIAAGAFAGYRFDKWSNYGRSSKAQIAVAMIVGGTVSGLIGASMVQGKIDKIGK